MLSHEMALTGCEGQSYTLHSHEQGGPVFLVYYSPAFMRTAAKSNAYGGLRILAEIYRQARSLWPFQKDGSLKHVTIRVDQIKETQPDELMDAHKQSAGGEGYLLVKHNEREAMVERHPIYNLSSEMNQFRVLRFWRKSDVSEEDAFLQELEELRHVLMRNESTPGRLVRLQTTGRIVVTPPPVQGGGGGGGGIADAGALEA